MQDAPFTQHMVTHTDVYSQQTTVTAAAAAVPLVPSPPAKSPDSGGSGGTRGGTTAAAGALGMCRSVAPPATRHMSGPMMDNSWDFERANDKPVRLLLQVRVQAGSRPMS